MHATAITTLFGTELMYLCNPKVKSWNMAMLYHCLLSLILSVIPLSFHLSISAPVKALLMYLRASAGPVTVPSLPSSHLELFTQRLTWAVVREWSF